MPHTKLYSIFQTSQILANSFHHQAVKKIAANFVVSAKSLDGIVEAIEFNHPDYFAVAVQWHPEVMTEDHPEMNKLFHAFVQSASRFL